jgi:hypothetical protein
LILRLSGCQVLRRQSLSDNDSLRDHWEVAEVGDEGIPLLVGGGAPTFEALAGPGLGPNIIGLPPVAPGDWNGLFPEGTLKRRPGVREPVVYMLWDREWEVAGEETPGPHRGLLCPVKNVEEVGVPYSLGETGRYWGNPPSIEPRYDSNDSRDRGSAMTRGGGRRLAS